MNEWRRVAVVIGFMFFLFMAGCSGDANGQSCSEDSDCSDGHYCAVSGGVFFSSAVCVLTSSPVGLDVGGEDVEPDGDDVESGGHDVDEGDAQGHDVDEGDVQVLEDGEDGDDVEEPGEELVVVIHEAPEGKTLDKMVRFEFECEDNAIRQCSYGCTLENNDGEFENLGVCESGLELDLRERSYGDYRLRVVATDIFGNQATAAVGWAFGLAWEMVSAGFEHTCGILNNGALYCWGKNTAGCLGSGVDVGGIVTTPQRVGTANDWVYIATERAYSCGIREGGSLWCWGHGANGQLGIGLEELDDSARALRPALLKEPKGAVWTSVSLSELHACGVQEDKSFWCWGANKGPAFGFADEGHYYRPMQISKDLWISVYAGDGYTCAMSEENEVSCMGSNKSGQLGLGLKEEDNVVGGKMIKVEDKWRSFAAGRGYGCGVKDEGSLWCWGGPVWGRLGIEDVKDDDMYLKPELVDMEMKWRLVEVKSAHTCAIDERGMLWCWGSNSVGQLGLGGLESQKRPAEVSDGWVGVDLGKAHTCGIRESGELYCWGDGTRGETGQGNTGIWELPTKVELSP